MTREVFFKENIQPDPSKRRFYPKLSDIRSHTYRASIKNRFSKIDQENVTEQQKQWKAMESNGKDFFYFRPYGEVRCSNITGEGEAHLLLVVTSLLRPPDISWCVGCLTYQVSCKKIKGDEGIGVI